MPKSKFIVITPYYKESERLLRRCIDSVARQTIRCEHFLIADGFPQDWIDGAGVKHLKLDAEHADYGNTPRGVGALIAIAEGYEGIGLLDADNWLEPDHIEICLEAAEKCPGGTGNCDYVVASRLFRRPDETIMQISDEPDHVDTNCFFFFRGAFSIVPHWALMPKVVSPICDRIFYSLIKSKPLTSVKTKKPSVNYQTLWSSQYRALGETPPEGAKHDVDPSQIRVWADSQSSREVEIVNRLVGFSFLHDTAFVRARRSLEEAVSFQQRGLLRQSENAYAKTIEEYPDYFDALHFYGLFKYQSGHLHDALQLLLKATALNPRSANALNSRGVVLGALGRHQEALASFDSTLALESNHVVALSNRGNCLNELGRYEEALHSANRAIGVNPNHPEAYIPRAAAQRECKRYAEALESYGQAIKFNPNFTTAWVGLGNVFCDLKRHDEALAAHDKALALDPNLANAWLGRGNVFTDLRRYDEAFAAYDKALALKADLPEAWLGRGNVFTNLKRYDEALAAYDKVITLESDFSESWLGRGNVFANLRRYDEAFAAYDRAFALETDLEGAEGARLHAKMYCCDWKEFRAECDHLLSSIRNGKVNTEPFAMLAIPSSPDDQLRCSKLWVAERNPPVEKPIWQGERYNHSRTRVAYLSADFYQHATSYLAAGMFECHDKSRFDVTAISIGPNNASEMRKRLEAAFERFVDAENYSDERVADQIRDSEIDILIDLKGFTADSRTGILARRAAPVQVNYLGYPGTMGAPFIDYIVADRVLIPETQREFYSEKVVVLPNSYQVNDRARPVSDRSFTRRECGLPDTGFVFCCFNGAYKITPSIFDSWMRILKQVEGSVLWLLGDSANVMSNLREEAAARGVTGERLVFASRMSLPEHLARHRLADLFLDTLPYNAHTTASDALWAGLPVLTCAGETFASRVAASLLCATGLPELITTTPEVYEQMAVELAVRPGHVADIKRKLSENRLSAPLFDTARFTRHIEAAYAAMHDRHQAGLAPDHINVPDL